MATCESINDECENKWEKRRKQVMLGDLPSDFLRVSPLSSEQQLSLDEQTALALQRHYTVLPLATRRLVIGVVEAKLNKNYGLTRMDPYVRLRVGNALYETNTDHNGARNPVWNKTFNCIFVTHDTTLHIEVFDECAFSLDERIAWGSYELSKAALQGKTINEWIPLTGRLGEGKEGTIHIEITIDGPRPREFPVSFTPDKKDKPIPSGNIIYHPKSLVTVVPYGPFTGEQGKTECPDPRHSILDLGVHPSPMIPVVHYVPEGEFRQIREMFPNIEEDIVRAVLESNRGDKEHGINALLELSDVT